MKFTFRRLLERTSVSLLITFGWMLQAAGVVQLPSVEAVERWLYDARVTMTAPRGLDRRVVIVDIDERSLAQEGYWPWGRDRIASLLHTLFDEYDVGLVAFDVVFAEADRSSGLGLLEELRRSWLQDNPDFNEVLGSIRPALDWDQRFADAMRGREVVLGYHFTRNDAATAELPPPLPVLSEVPPGELPLPAASGYTGIHPPLRAAARSAGFLDNPAADPDGVHRRLPLIQTYDGELYESFALAVLRQLHGGPPVRFEFGKGPEGQRALSELRFGGFRVPVDAQARALVPYRGRQGSFPYVSAAAVLSREVTPELLRDAIVLVGITSPELSHLRVTPLQGAYPGIEIQANMISGMLDGVVRVYPDYARPLELLLLLLTGLAISFLMPRVSPTYSLFLAGGLAGAITLLNLVLWSGRGEVIPLASSYLLIAFLFVFHMTLGYMRERHLKGRLEYRFGQYVPQALVEKMSAAPREEYGFSGELREMTVLFADLRGFTRIAETLPAQELTQFMHEWLTPMTRIIHRHRGTVDKYMGDCIMAFWGAPLADEDHAANALRAAIEMQLEILRLNRQFARRRWPRLRLGIGVHTGEMRVGNMGSEFRVAYTVLGDAVNIGSRLEGLTTRYGVPLIVSGQVRAKVPEYEYIELDRVRVKNKSNPVTLYYPLGRRGALTAERVREMELYHRALELYLRQEWDEAERLFTFIRRGSRFQRLYQIYLDRIDYYRKQSPGIGWDGVFTYLSK